MPKSVADEGRRARAATSTRRRVWLAAATARRVARERRRHERISLIARVGHLVAGNLLLDELLERAADAIHTILGYENVAIPLVDPADPSSMVLTAFGGSYKHTIGGFHRIPVTSGIMGACVTSRETILVNDVSKDPRYFPTPSGAHATAELAVPILLGSRALGVLNVEAARAFTSEDADGLGIVADQLAVAIDNARLHELAQNAAVLEERNRLARDLHDSVTQQLFSAVLVAQTIGEAYARDREEGARRCETLLGLARAALAEMRSLLAELRPSRDGPGAASTREARETGELALVRREGLLASLRAHVQTTELNGLQVSVRGDGYVRQPGSCEEALYRIAREALHNVVKHAGARTAEVQLGADGGVLKLIVRDDGCGFDAAVSTGAATQTAAMHGGGIGLASMRERIATLGGDLRVESMPGNGTVVEARVPIFASGLVTT